MAAKAQRVDDYKDVVVRYNPHSAQCEFHADNHRFRVLACGARWGKERSCIPEMINMISAQSQEIDRPDRRFVPNIHWWAIAPKYALAKQLWLELKYFTPRELVKSVTETKGNQCMQWRDCYGGALIEVKSAHNPDELVSVGLDGMLVTEAGLIKSETWEDSLRPRLSSRQGVAIFNGTPRGKWEGRGADGKKIKSLLYNLYLKGQMGDPEWQSFNFPTWTNPYIPPSEIESMRRDMDPRLFAQNVGAEFIDFAIGKPVYAGVWKDEAIKPVYEAWGSEDVYMGFDRGYHHPAAVWAYINSDDQLCVAKEWMPADIERDKFIEQCMRKTQEWFPGAKPYSYQPHDFANTNDDGKNWHAVCIKFGFPGKVGKRTNDAEIRRVEAVRKKMRLREDTKFGMLTDPSCEILIEGFQGAFAFPDVIDRPEDEKPYKDGFYDHLQEALGELCLQHFKATGESDGKGNYEQYVPKHDQFGRPV